MVCAQSSALVPRCEGTTDDHLGSHGSSTVSWQAGDWSKLQSDRRMGKLSCGIEIRGVYEKDGSYYKVVRNKWHKLSRIDEGVRELHKRLYQFDPSPPGTIR